MDQILKFPDPHQMAIRRGAEFQRLSADQRVKDLVDTIQCGMFLLSHSPDRPIIDRLFLDRERKWQLTQREIFLRHGR